MALLLDTCALIFLTANVAEAGKATAALQRAYETDEMVFVSPISAWEIGLLVSLGRLNLSIAPKRWFDSVLQKPGIALAELSSDVLISSSFLPDLPLRDPADRIIVATAREYGFTLLTRDKQLLAYSDRGHIRALAC
ncbi:type II toxin-antitoxin system VapC family toxin [Rhodopseudomonas palustris]|uniref:PilT protein-like n=1 Tax=Rhodopseudomonas palustris (strain BisB18) TaxID=316056 RepID=Q215W4_RHOPB